MSGNEFAEWIAYYSLEPFGEARADWRGALVPFMLACFFHQKGRKPKFHDFLYPDPTENERKPRMSLEAMQSTLKGIVKRQEANREK